MYYHFIKPRLQLHEVAIPIKNTNDALNSLLDLLNSYKYINYKKYLYLFLNYLNQDKTFELSRTKNGSCMSFDFIISDYNIEIYNDLTNDYYDIMIKHGGLIHYSKSGNYPANKIKKNNILNNKLDVVEKFSNSFFSS
jgi:hypothetical protein